MTCTVRPAAWVPFVLVGRVTSRTPVLRIRGAAHSTRADTVAAEEPLEIRLGGSPLAVTMRTPGDDFDLVHGFLATEAVIRSAEDVAGLRYCNSVDEDGRNTYNVVDVDLAPGVRAPDTALDRNFYTSSSCGVCGKASIDAIRTRTSFDVAADPVRVPLEVLLALPDRLRAAQQVFERTGGLHGAGVFTADGSLVALREDVGRHNAVDKVIGDAVRAGRLPLAGHVLMLSGRSSFELTQKAAMAGIPVLAAVSAPSSLAVELAREVGITLVGFLRGDGCNVYSCPERLVLPED
jgi:FdhD protein